MKRAFRTLTILILIAALAMTLAACFRRSPEENGGGTVVENVFDETKLAEFMGFLGTTHTTGFIIWRDGEILLEKYWGTNGEHVANNIASAGKSFCSVLVGIAQDRKLLSLDDKITDYIGHGFSDMTPGEEDEITVRHLLSMTSGLGNLLEKEYPTGEGWAYSDCWNLLFNVLEEATGQTPDAFAKEVLWDKIGLEDTDYRSSAYQLRTLRKGKPDYKDWAPLQLYCSTRDMIRFGELMLNRGTYNGERVVSEEYCNAALTASNSYNQAYGYLFWLNSSESAIGVDGEPFGSRIIPSAPVDTVCALGMGDKKIYIVPSLNMVIARQGSYDSLLSLASTDFDNELWEQLNLLFGFGA